MLTLSGVHTRYGQVEALRGVDLTVGRSEIVSLIGANGAGKSTLLMTICGLPQPTAGKIAFEGIDITRGRTQDIIRMGIAHVPERRRIFPRLTVLENLQLGATFEDGAHFAEALDRVFALFPILKIRQRQRGGTMSGGEQQMLAISRALMSRPRLLLLDEPSLGLAPLMVRRIFEVIREINTQQKVAILIVEQNARLALNMADRGYVLQGGRVVLQGTGQQLLASHEVHAAYLDGGL